MSKIERNIKLMRQEEQRRGCEICGATSGDFMFVRKPESTEKQRVSRLVYSGLAVDRLLRAMADSHLYCRDCYGRERGYGGKLYIPVHNDYKRCDHVHTNNTPCMRKAKFDFRGQSYCKDCLSLVKAQAGIFDE